MVPKHQAGDVAVRRWWKKRPRYVAVESWAELLQALRVEVDSMPHDRRVEAEHFERDLREGQERGIGPDCLLTFHAVIARKA